MSIWPPRTLLWLVILAPFCSALPAQEPAKTASIEIDVMDLSGARVPNAQVLILPLSCQLGKKFITGNEGKLSLEVPPGSYEVRVRVPPFRPAKEQFDVHPGTHQTIVVTLLFGNTTELVVIRTQIPVSFPEEAQAVSYDGRYVIVSKGRPLAPHHTLWLEDRILKTRRKVFSYDRRAVVLWNPYGKSFAVTNYIGNNSSHCIILSTDENTAPIQVLDLLFSDPDVSEQQCLKSLLRNQRVLVEAVGWTLLGEFKAKVSVYTSMGELGFDWEFAMPAPLEKP